MSRTFCLAARPLLIIVGIWVIGLHEACLAQAPAGQSLAHVIVGQWRAEQVLGPEVQGEISIDASGSQWHARISGFEATVQHSDQSITFALPQAKGEFRGYIASDSKTIHGHWIQPSSSFYNSRYASPVELRKVTPSLWKGTVNPLPERCSFYLLVQRQRDGSMQAVIRNPEFNYFSNQSYKVEFSGSTVVLSNSGAKFQGMYDEHTGLLSFRLLNSHAAFQFKRQSAGAPSTDRGAKLKQRRYIYRQPIQENDGWETASLDNVGIRPKPLTDLINQILNVDPASTPVNIQALLIARHGKLVLEEYFQGFDKDRPHDLRSASKTFAPLLVGIARSKGFTVGPETAVYSSFPQYRKFANWDERKQKMTLHHVMSMTSGFDCEDSDSSSPGSEVRMQSQTVQPDWYKYTLDLPMARDPGGTHAVYCSADLNLVGGIVRNTVDLWLPDFFNKFFAGPLQIRSYYFNLMPTGDGYMGGGLYLRPRDSLKLGQLYLSGGVWNERRLIAREWVKASTTSYAVLAPVISTDINHEYGYGWHIHRLIAGRAFRTYSAEGNGGQFITVIPALDMVIGIFGGSYNNIDEWYRWQLELMPRYIIPAAVRGTPN